VLTHTEDTELPSEWVPKEHPLLFSAHGIATEDMPQRRSDAEALAAELLAAQAPQATGAAACKAAKAVLDWKYNGERHGPQAQRCVSRLWAKKVRTYYFGTEVDQAVQRGAAIAPNRTCAQCVSVKSADVGTVACAPHFCLSICTAIASYRCVSKSLRRKRSCRCQLCQAQVRLALAACHARAHNVMHFWSQL
jgi:hypothetical protein